MNRSGEVRRVNNWCFPAGTVTAGVMRLVRLLPPTISEYQCRTMQNANLFLPAFTAVTTQSLQNDFGAASVTQIRKGHVWHLAIQPGCGPRGGFCLKVDLRGPVIGDVMRLPQMAHRVFP